MSKEECLFDHPEIRIDKLCDALVDYLATQEAYAGCTSITIGFRVSDKKAKVLRRSISTQKPYPPYIR